MNRISKKTNKILSNTALLATKANANSVCVFVIHQPKLPEGAKKLRNF